MSVNIDYYGDFSVDKTPPMNYPISSERVNLIKGKKQKIKNFELIEKNHQTDWFNTPVESPKLTDGIFATEPDCNDEAFFHFTSGSA